MAALAKLDVEIELKSPVDKFWNSIRNSTTVFPKAFPDLYKSVEIIEGDGKSVGSVFLYEYVQGSSIVPSWKEKIEAVDEDNKMIEYNVIGDEILKYYTNFKARFCVTPKGDGSVVNWFCQFEKASRDVPDPNHIRDSAVKTLKKLDEYVSSS